MKFLLLALLISTSTALNASVILVNQERYKVDFIRASFTELKPVLEDQVWWGDLNLSLEFASTLNLSLGTPNTSSFSTTASGPYFSYTDFAGFAGEGLNTGIAWYGINHPTRPDGVVSGTVIVSLPSAYAIAQRVPEPTSVFLLAIGFLIYWVRRTVGVRITSQGYGHQNRCAVSAPAA